MHPTCIPSAFPTSFDLSVVLLFDPFTVVVVVVSPFVLCKKLEMQHRNIIHWVAVVDRWGSGVSSRGGGGEQE